MVFEALGGLTVLYCPWRVGNAVATQSAAERGAAGRSVPATRLDRTQWIIARFAADESFAKALCPGGWRGSAGGGGITCMGLDTALSVQVEGIRERYSQLV